MEAKEILVDDQKNQPHLPGAGDGGIVGFFVFGADGCLVAFGAGVFLALVGDSVSSSVLMTTGTGVGDDLGAFVFVSFGAIVGVGALVSLPPMRGI